MTVIAGNIKRPCEAGVIIVQRITPMKTSSTKAARIDSTIARSRSMRPRRTNQIVQPIAPINVKRSKTTYASGKVTMLTAPNNAQYE